MSDTNAAAAEEAPAPKGKKMMLAILLVGGVVIGGGAGALFAGPAIAEMVMGPAPVAPGDTAAAHGEEEAHAEEEEGGHGEEGEHGAVAPVYQIDNLVLNPAQSGGTRFLMLTVAFDLKDEAAVASMASRDAEVRDVVLSVIGAKTVEQLVEISAREALKTELQNSVSGLFSKGTVKKIYFPQFVIQ